MRECAAAARLASQNDLSKRSFTTNETTRRVHECDISSRGDTLTSMEPAKAEDPLLGIAPSSIQVPATSSYLSSAMLSAQNDILSLQTNTTFPSVPVPTFAVGSSVFSGPQLSNGNLAMWQDPLPSPARFLREDHAGQHASSHRPSATLLMPQIQDDFLAYRLRSLRERLHLQMQREQHLMALMNLQGSFGGEVVITPPPGRTFNTRGVHIQEDGQRNDQAYLAALMMANCKNTGNNNCRPS